MNAVTASGDIASVTTTSGLSWKIPGRVGDSPIIGAGQYCDNEVGAAGSTGRGEANIKVCGAFLAVEFMRQGMSPQQALMKVMERVIAMTEKRLLDDNGTSVLPASVLRREQEGRVRRRAAATRARSSPSADANGARLEDCAYMFKKSSSRRPPISGNDDQAVARRRDASAFALHRVGRWSLALAAFQAYAQRYSRRARRHRLSRSERRRRQPVIGPALINLYWSPLYPVLIGVARVIAARRRRAKSLTMHAVNVVLLRRDVRGVSSTCSCSVLALAPQHAPLGPRRQHGDRLSRMGCSAASRSR